MSAKSIRKNYIYNLAYQILTLITPFLTTPYVSRILSPYNVGLQSFATAVSMNFMIFAGMGIGIYGQREVSYAQDNRKELTKVFWNLRTLSLITSSIWLVIYVTLVLVYIKNHYALFFILSINIIGVFMDCTYFFAGLEEFGKIVFRQFIFKVLDIAFIFIFVKHESDLSLYVFGSLFFNIIMINATLYPELPKYIDWPDWKNLDPFHDFKTIISLFIPTIAIQVYSILDKVMLGFIVENSPESGYYEFALRISKMPLMVVASLSSVMIPRIGYLFKQNKQELIREYILKSFKFIWFISVPLCLGLIALSDNFVIWFLGETYAKVADLLKVSSFLLIIIGLSNITGSQYMIPTGMQNKFTITVTLGAIVNFSLNLVLIRYFYSYGALVASVLAELSVLLSQLYILKKEFDLLKVFSCGIKYIFAGLVMFGVLSTFNYKLPINFIGTMTIIFSGVLIYFGVLLLIRDEFFIVNIKRVFGVIGNKVRSARAR